MICFSFLQGHFWFLTYSFWHLEGYRFFSLNNVWDNLLSQNQCTPGTSYVRCSEVICTPLALHRYHFDLSGWRYLLFWRTTYCGGSREGARGPGARVSWGSGARGPRGPGAQASPLFLDQTEARKGENTFFGHRPPPPPPPTLIWRSGSATGMY